MHNSVKANLQGAKIMQSIQVHGSLMVWFNLKVNLNIQRNGQNIAIKQSSINTFSQNWAFEKLRWSRVHGGI